MTELQSHCSYFFALASGALAARFELDANTIAYKDAKTSSSFSRRLMRGRSS